MRELTDHKGSSANDGIRLQADVKNVSYSASWLEKRGGVTSGTRVFHDLTFHTGNPSGGINGITDEVLLAIVIDRLKGWQEGPHKCRENALAQTHIETGLMWMQKRTRERQARGVEGTQEV